MRVDEALGEELRRLGTQVIFSVPASETMRIIAAATARGIEHLSARHEQAAVGMADGYHRMSGRVGVVLLGRGAGLTNGVNALVTARKADSGVLVIAGELDGRLAADPVAASRHVMAVKTIDQTGFLKSIGVDAVTLSDPTTAVEELGAAMARATGGRTVAVLLRADVAAADASDAVPSADPASMALPGPNPQAADPAQVALIVDHLAEGGAARPVVLAGRGAVVSGAEPSLTRLADRIGALLGSTLLARPLFTDDPYAIGVVGTMATPATAQLVADSDLVIAFGASLNLYTTFGGDLVRRARIVQVDSDPTAIGAHVEVDLGLVGDARLVADQILAGLDGRGVRLDGYRRAVFADAVATARSPEPMRDEGRDGALDPRLLCRQLDELLPRDRTVVVDNGAHMSFTTRYLRVAEPGALLMTSSYGSVGAAQGVALGAAAARRDRPTVLAIGDGGFMMTLADLDTAVRHRLPIVYVVMDDGAFAAEVHHLRAAGLPDDLARYANPSLADVARAIGARSLTVRSWADLAAVPELVEALEGPVVIDCHTSLDVRGGHVDLIMRAR
ncbi:MAG: thiamine pyrophosphate-binding protein [Acidimicrobiia bacterium]